MKKIILITMVSVLITLESFSMVNAHLFAKGDYGWGSFGFGNCEDGYGLCFDITSTQPAEGDDIIKVNIDEMVVTVSLYKDNHERIEEMLSHHKIVLKSNSGISLEVMEELGVKNGKYYKMNKGEYDYQLIDNYYVFNVRLSEVHK